MCGIWGYQFKSDIPAEYKSFTSRAIYCALMMKAMDDRGDESYGFVLRLPDKLNVVKGVGASADKVDPQVVAGTLQLMAHTRKATSGSICEVNAHPFTVGNIIGMHNGGVSNDAYLNTKYGRHCDVDSEHIFHHIAHKLPLEEISGYGAVSYQDTDTPDRVYFGKSEHGQLDVYGIVERGGDEKSPNLGVVWASTDLQMKKAMQMVGWTAFPYSNLKAQRLYFVEGGQVTDHAAFSLGWQVTTSVTVVKPPFSSQSGATMTGLRGTDWDERIHPDLGTLQRCYIKDNAVTAWVLSKGARKFLDRKRKREAESDSKGTTDLDLLVKECQTCHTHVALTEIRFSGISRQWICDMCHGEMATDWMGEC